MEFSIGQSFEGKYPPEAAVWCNKNSAYIIKEDGKFIIKTIPEPSLEELKKNKLQELNQKFLEAEENGTLDSSVGFTIDATERSNRDIDGLIKSLEATKQDNTRFCAADNTFHEVTLDNLKIMQLEVIAYGQKLYAKKWTYREQINAAKSKADIDQIIIDFSEEQ